MNTIRRSAIFFGAVLLALLGGRLALAAPLASPWVETDQTQVRLVTAADAIAETGTLGLQFKLKPGWKIYWRSPGDAGFPPRLDWSASTNISSLAMAWPAPERFSVLGLETLGYKDEVVLPVTIIATEPGKPVHLETALDYLTCNDICIPYSARLALDLPATAAKPTEFAQLISRYQAKVPGDGEGRGFQIDSAWVERQETKTAIKVAASAAWPFAHPDLFAEADPELSFGAPVVTLGDEGKSAILTLSVVTAKGTAATLLAARPVTLTLVDGPRAIEKNLLLTTPPAAHPASPAAAGFLAALALALLGGLILNLMPCVLPVLSLKLLAVLGQGGAERRQIRQGFVASAAGVVAAFLGLAGVLAALKAAGLAVGWGIQFQEPVFLLTMAMILVVFAANLWGLFNVGLPQFIAALGETADGRQRLAGPFLGGAFATLLATPCSAPFLGAAIGFALARGPIEIVAIFAAIGLGMALPYLAVAAWPGLVARLPRPGAWMNRLRRVFAVALGATAVWLLALALPLTGSERFTGLSGRSAPQGYWTAFNPAAIPTLVAQGKTVFVDVTADWCITCLTNKALVLDRDEVAGRLKDSSVVAMRADWTRPDPIIADYLASFGRYGIPFDVVYGPGTPGGLPLSEVLTRDAVEAALTQANRSQTATRP